GKTTCARILAKKINEDGTQREDEDFAFNIFELDAASNNSVDDIRNLIDQVRIPPQVGKYKVYIIDEVHMLSQSAFNAFLKTLEEPPKHAIFILATTEKHKIIPTILSRCQIFDFKRITVKDAAKYLKYIAESQGIDAEEDALHIIAQKADGAMRDALSIFDRVVSFSGKKLTRKAVTENLNVLDYETYFTATSLILDHDIPGLLLLLNKTLALGFDGHHFINGLASHFRDLMVCQYDGTVELLEVGDEARKKYLEQAKNTSYPFLLKALDLTNDCDLKYKSSKNQRLLVELTLMKLASIDFEGEKKNPESLVLANKTIDFIAPASFYRERPVTNTGTKNEPGPKEAPPVVSNGINANDTKESLRPEKQIQTEDDKGTSEGVITATVSKINIQKDVKRVSSWSISGLKAKKEHLQLKEGAKIDRGNLPNDAFTEEVLVQHWNQFVKNIDEKGQKILSSNLATDIPKILKGDTIWIELPNDTMKKEVEREQNKLLDHLRSKLNNHRINLKITVNEEAAKKYAFTPEEKYQKLREKNPAIDLLRQEFDLDL
ncbi:MAG: DNA polymerase III subunit gamma/tau, partial [Flavobacteriaceae bacterium]